MMRRIFIPLFTLIAVAIGVCAHAAQGDEFLDPEVAFKYSSRALDRNTLEVTFKIVDGYYLYRDKFHFSVEPASVKLGTPQFPKGQVHNDEFFGKVETFRGDLKIRLPIDTAGAAVNSVKLKTVYQGCADAGICYPPQDQTAQLSLTSTQAGGVASATGGGFSELLGKSAPPAMSSIAKSAPLMDTPAVPVAALGAARAFAPAAKPVTSAGGDTGLDTKVGQVVQSAAETKPVVRPALPESEESHVVAVLRGGNFWAIIAFFLGVGLLLALTPCVFPMIPIISGIIVGEGSRITRSRSFMLSLSYVLGMAITYTAAGIAAGLSGTLLSNALQNIWVLGAFALVFVALSLSMFGFYELQLPTALQSKLADTSNRIGGGKMSGSFFMGALSAVIVGPCVAAPLAAALLYIGQTHNVFLGGAALFAMAIGMGVPLLLIGLSAGTLLPRAGAWMDAVKRFFGVMLLALAIWIVSPVLPAIATMLAVAALLIVSAIYLNAIDPLPPHAHGAHRFWKGVGVIALVAGIALLIGALSGSRDVLQPLSGLRMASGSMGSSTQVSQQAAQFQRIKSVADLDRQVRTANKPVMLDFYADWCVSCKEMEHYTFNDPQVQAKFAGMLLLQADVTANDEQDKALLKRFGLYGPPGIIFFDGHGGELADAKVIGYQASDNFLKTLNYVTGS
jgi:thioredoxin:protein disulfide reductase